MFILELLAWLAGTLAFKTDINARENFLETAEARESILRLARFLSYNPRRNQSARGLVKIVEIATDDDVIDSFGINLNNTVVKWDDPDDPDWQERFTLILNNAFTQNNQFGQPLKSALLSNVRTQHYRINNRIAQMSQGFTATTNGERMSFELCNGDFDEVSGFYERSPSNDAAFHLYYRSDGNGNSSSNTGFFMLFKQGTLEKQTFTLPIPVENQLINIETTGINDSDVWVQTVDDSGTVLTEWQKVPTILGENTTFNSLPVDQRNIYQVITRDDDKISVRFSDGRFGAAPVGNLRVWYRVSNGLRYQIRPQDIDRMKVSIPFTNKRGVPRTLTVTFSLQESVSNSAPRETDDQIRRRAPSVYASQNRMVSGEDYNTFPLQSNVAIKMKAVNRIYSGHSRFIDLTDPTGNYQDTKVFSDDGSFYVERNDYYTEVPLSLNRSPAEVIALYIEPTLIKQEVHDYVTDILLKNVKTAPVGARWRQSTVSQFSSTGYFQYMDNFPFIKQGAFIRYVNASNVQVWTSVGDVQGSITTAPLPGFRGPVTLTTPVTDNVVVEKVIPAYQASIDGETAEGITQRLSDNQSFTLWYNMDNASWVIGDYEPTGIDIDGLLIRVMSVDYADAGLWRITTRGLRYVFESYQDVQWYFQGNRTVDSATGLQKQDLIRVMSVNPDLNDMVENGSLTGLSLRRNFDLAIHKLIENSDGSSDPRRVSVKLIDSDEDGAPDEPDAFYRIVAHREKVISDSNRLTVPAHYSHLFWIYDYIRNIYIPLLGGVWVFEEEADRVANITLPNGSVVFQINSPVKARRNTFWVKENDQWRISVGEYKHAVGRGKNVASGYFVAGSQTASSTSDGAEWINFLWKHYAPSDHRIDPSKTNIIDIFVLTNEYDFLTRLWVANGADPVALPLPPTELDLRIAFSEFDNYKMFSDEIVWRPVQYKFMFGSGAADELRGQFKVVKLPSSPLSDGEIKSRVIRAVNDYFNVSMWDFGETFYFTELAAYVHQQLAGVIGSFVFVPTNEDSRFGEGFEVKCRSDEIFLSTAQVSDVIIINSNTASNLRIR